MKVPARDQGRRREEETEEEGGDGGGRRQGGKKKWEAEVGIACTCNVDLAVKTDPGGVLGADHTHTQSQCQCGLGREGEVEVHGGSMDGNGCEEEDGSRNWKGLKHLPGQMTVWKPWGTQSRAGGGNAGEEGDTTPWVARVA